MATDQNNILLQQERAVEQQQIPAYLQRTISIEAWKHLTLEQQDILRHVEKSMPTQLNGVVPESVWSTLSTTQKMEFLFGHNLLPRFEFNIDPIEQSVEHGFDGAMQGTESLSVEQAEERGVEILVQDHHESRKNFREEVEKMNKIEGQYLSENDQPDQPADQIEDSLAIEDQQRIKVEQGNNLMPTLPTFVGYNPSDDLVNNYQNYATGSTTKSKTWIASMVQKFIDSLSLERAE